MRTGALGTISNSLAELGEKPPWSLGDEELVSQFTERHHHRLIHQGEWQVRLGPDRLPEFLPPARLDPERKPRRNNRLRAGP